MRVRACSPERALLSFPSLDYQSKEDSRLTNTRLFGAVRSELVLHCNRRPPSASHYRRGQREGGVVSHACRRCQFGIPCDVAARFVALAMVPQMRCVFRTAASSLTARVDPIACPVGRVLQCLLFTLEVIERIEPVAAFDPRAVDAFEQQVG